MAVIFTGFFTSLVGMCIAGAAFWAGPSLPDPLLGALAMVAGLGLTFLGVKIIEGAE